MFISQMKNADANSWGVIVKDFKSQIGSASHQQMKIFSTREEAIQCAEVNLDTTPGSCIIFPFKDAERISNMVKEIKPI